MTVVAEKKTMTGMIAMCDILGFSEWIKSVSLADVPVTFNDFILRPLYYSLHKEHAAESFNLYPNFIHPHVGVAWFSDTIFLYTKTNCPEADRNLIEAVGWLLFFSIARKPFFLENPHKLRGAIAYGELFIDAKRNLFFGNPIAEAYKLEQAQEWSGVALADSARKRLIATPDSHGKFPDWLIEYPVPCKDGEQERLVINWPKNGIPLSNWRLNWSEHSAQPTSDDEAKHRCVVDKFKHTKTFYDLHKD